VASLTAAVRKLHKVCAWVSVAERNVTPAQAEFCSCFPLSPTGGIVLDDTNRATPRSGFCGLRLQDWMAVDPFFHTGVWFTAGPQSRSLFNVLEEEGARW
jgi:hypothetical protein